MTYREHRRIQMTARIIQMSKTITLRLDETTYEELKEAARSENRPLSNLIQTAALARIRERQFVDDVEMAEILEDEALVERLRTGSDDARRRRSSLVE